jgi:hypothetical protein
MQDAPTPEQLLAAVARYLRDEAGPALAAHGDNALAYQARVAANVLDTVRRQGLLAPAADAAERTRLQALLGSAEHDLAGLNRQLAQALAQGAIDATQPALADHLWRTTFDKLAVDQPGYDTYRRLAAPPPGPDA